MVRAWFMDDSSADQREPHMQNPPAFLDLKELNERTGVEYLSFPVEGLDDNPEFLKLKKQRGYTYEDKCTISRDALPNYDEKLKIFYTEHLHSDEEIRFINDGSGYFDLRDKEDKWIRVEVVKGDMLIVPAGIYHRFTLDVNNFIIARRLFIGEPVWTPINRPGADDHPIRKEYLKKISNGLA